MISLCPLLGFDSPEITNGKAPLIICTIGFGSYRLFRDLCPPEATYDNQIELATKHDYYRLNSD